MNARPAVLLLALLASCAGPSTARAPDSRAGRSHPETDPAQRGAPAGGHDLLPIEQVSVRAHRTSDGRVTIVEFLSPGLPESQQVALRLELEAGKLRLAGQGAGGEESWVTTLMRAR